MIEKQEKFDSEKYRRWIASLPCVITGARDVQCAHIRMGSDAGLGRKPADFRTLPLSCAQHARQHHIGELKFWYPFGGYETAAVLARELYEARYDTPRALELIAAYRGRWVGRGPGAYRHKFIDQKGDGNGENSTA